MKKPPYTLDRDAGLVVNRRALIESGIMNQQFKAADRLYKQRGQHMSENNQPPAIGHNHQLAEQDSDPGSPIERLRAFCIGAMSEQDWIVASLLLDAIERESEQMRATIDQFIANPRNMRQGEGGDVMIESFGPVKK